MKNRCDYWAALAIDMAAQCSVDATLDIKYVEQRVANEGETFFLVTLPQFAKDLELALEDHLVSPLSFVGFHRRTRPVKVGNEVKKISGGLPDFLGSFTQLIFDDSPELVLDEYLDLQEAERFSGRPVHQFLPPTLRETSSRKRLEKMADAIAAIRQLCLAFSKVEEVPTPEKIALAVEGYKSTEEELLLPFRTEG